MREKGVNPPSQTDQNPARPKAEKKPRQKKSRATSAPKQKGRRHRCLHAGHRTYALRDEAPVHYQYATLPMWQKTRNKNHEPQVPNPPPVPRRFTPPEHQEQQLFMGRPVPSPPRFATAREDGAHCGASPPVHFQVCSHPVPHITSTLKGA